MSIITNPQQSFASCLVDSTLLLTMNGVRGSYADDWLATTWLFVVALSGIVFWMWVLYHFIQQRTTQKVIPVYPPGKVPTIGASGPGRSMLPPPRKSWNQKKE